MDSTQLPWWWLDIPKVVTRAGKGGTIPWAPKSPNDVTSSFFNTANFLSERPQVRTWGRQSVFFPRRHLTLLRPCYQHSCSDNRSHQFCLGVEDCPNSNYDLYPRFEGRDRDCLKKPRPWPGSRPKNLSTCNWSPTFCLRRETTYLALHQACCFTPKVFFKIYLLFQQKLFKKILTKTLYFFFFYPRG